MPMVCRATTVTENHLAPLRSKDRPTIMTISAHTTPVRRVSDD